MISMLLNTRYSSGITLCLYLRLLFVCEAAGKNIPSCQSTELKEIKEGEEDYQDSEEEAATLPKSEFPSFTSIIGAGSYNVVSKPTLYFV